MEKKKRQVVDHHVETFSFPFLTATSIVLCNRVVHCIDLDLDLIFQFQHFFNLFFDRHPITTNQNNATRGRMFHLPRQSAKVGIKIYTHDLLRQGIA